MTVGSRVDVVIHRETVHDAEGVHQTLGSVAYERADVVAALVRQAEALKALGAVDGVKQARVDEGIVAPPRPQHRRDAHEVRVEFSVAGVRHPRGAFAVEERELRVEVAGEIFPRDAGDDGCDWVWMVARVREREDVRRREG